MDSNSSGLTLTIFFIKRIALWMLEPPWYHSGLTDSELDYLGLTNSEYTVSGQTVSGQTYVRQINRILQHAHWFMWLIGWLWTLAGLFLGALIAPSLLRLVGLADTPYQNWLVVAVAVVAGFLVQFIGWLMIVPLLVIIMIFWAVAGVAALWFTVLFRDVTNDISADNPSGIPVSRKVTQTNSYLLTMRNLSAVIAFAVPLIGVTVAIYLYLSHIVMGQRLVIIGAALLVLIKTFVIPATISTLRSKAITSLRDWLRGGSKKSKST